VIDGRELKPPYVATGFVTLRSIIAKRPKLISQFMRTMAESMKLMVTDRDLAFRLMAKKIGLTDRKVFDAAYTAELKVIEPRFEVRPEAIQATLQEIAKTDPRANKVSANQLIDRRFLEEMEKGRDVCFSAFFAAISFALSSMGITRSGSGLPKRLR